MFIVIILLELETTINISEIIPVVILLELAVFGTVAAG